MINDTIFYELDTFPAENEEPPAKMTKLTIVDKSEDDLYNPIAVVECWACEPGRGRELPDA